MQQSCSVMTFVFMLLQKMKKKKKVKTNDLMVLQGVKVVQGV